MIQRIQTIYLLLAIILNIVCLSLPIGTMHYKEMIPDAYMYNFILLNNSGDGSSFIVMPLFIILLLSSVVSVFTIFQYKNRKNQMKMCSTCSIMNIMWVALYLVYYFFILSDNTKTIDINVAAALPIVSILFTTLAHKGIKHDEELVKAAGRIR